MNTKKLLNLIKKGEGTKLDFKQKLDLEVESGKKELAKDICAIANSKGGRGYILVGIEDKTKRIIGIKKDTISEEQIQQIISSRCEPPIPISFEYNNIDGKLVGVITIYDSEQKPHQLRENGSFYIRRGSTTDTMRKQELVSAFEDGLSLYIENCPIIKSSIKALNLELVDKYFSTKGISVTDENRLELMDNASIIVKDKDSNRYMVTLGGLLVFSEINSIYIPHNMVRIINQANKEFNQIIILQGSILTIMEKSEEILKKLLPLSYPIEAVYEGIKNALLYRDYSIFYKEIEVIIKENSIVVISPGTLIKTNKEKENYENYFKRNMWIYEKIITLDSKNMIVRSHRGFSMMKHAFKNKGKVIFVNSYENNYFKVIYPGINQCK